MQNGTFFLFCISSQDSHLHQLISYQFGNGYIMLAGQNLCRSHHTSLITVIISQQHAHQRNSGFTTPYITLYKTIHLNAALGISPDFFNYTLLCIGKLERQKFLVKTIHFLTNFIKSCSFKF
ncbi:hypothetical protein D3C73_1220310 [compost metagenome]